MTVLDYVVSFAGNASRKRNHNILGDETVAAVRRGNEMAASGMN